jgi:anaerobic selenocysteine-containing dehydrogenase
VLSAPNSDRLDRALGRLDFMVSVDCYLNETTRHADLVLPAVAPLERDHFDLLLNTLAIRNVVRYTPRLRAPAGEAREDWRILLDLAVGVGRRRAPVGWPASGRALGLRAITPSRLLALGLAGTRLRVAEAAPGACINSITTDTDVDELSGTSSWNGLHVTVTAAEPPKTLPNAALGTPDAR